MSTLALLVVASLPLPTLDRLAARSPRNAGMRSARAAALERAGDRDEALAEWRTVAELLPADHAPLLHVARLLADARRLDDAFAAADEAAGRGAKLLKPAPPVVPAGGSLPAAPAPIVMPRPDLFTGELLPAVAVRPPLPAIWFPAEVLATQGELLARAGRWGEAIDKLAEASARCPADLAVRMTYGRALLAWTRYDQAEAAFDAVLQRDADHPQARAGREYARAARNLPQLADPGDDPLARAARAYRRCYANDHAGAVEDALAALAAEPRSFDLIALTAKLLVAADQPTAAALVLSTGIGLPWPDDTRAGMLEGRALAWFQAGSVPAAERDARRAAALDPTTAHACHILGEVAEFRRDYRAALDHYAAALARNPGHGAAAFRTALLKASAPDPAVRDGEAAVELAGRMPDGYHTFGLRAAGHAEAGRFARAVADINAALAAQPPDAQREQFLAMRARFLADRPWRTGIDDPE